MLTESLVPKAAISDIQEAIDSQDWEAATRLCARIMTLPKDVVDGPFAASSVVSSHPLLRQSYLMQLAVANRKFTFIASEKPPAIQGTPARRVLTAI